MKFQKMNFLAGNLAKKGLDKQITAAQHVAYAESVMIRRFGDGALEQARPVYIKNRTLAIEVIHPAISEEIRRQEEGIISEVNQKIGYPEVIRIQCVLPAQRD
jgi:hypothetical protein